MQTNWLHRQKKIYRKSNETHSIETKNKNLSPNELWEQHSYNVLLSKIMQGTQMENQVLLSLFASCVFQWRHCHISLICQRRSLQACCLSSLTEGHRSKPTSTVWTPATSWPLCCFAWFKPEQAGAWASVPRYNHDRQLLQRSWVSRLHGCQPSYLTQRSTLVMCWLRLQSAAWLHTVHSWFHD